MLKDPDLRTVLPWCWNYVCALPLFFLEQLRTKVAYEAAQAGQYHERSRCVILSSVKIFEVACIDATQIYATHLVGWGWSQVATTRQEISPLGARLILLVQNPNYDCNTVPKQSCNQCGASRNTSCFFNTCKHNIVRICKDR